MFGGDTAKFTEGGSEIWRGKIGITGEIVGGFCRVGVAKRWRNEGQTPSFKTSQLGCNESFLTAVVDGMGG